MPISQLTVRVVDASGTVLDTLLGGGVAFDADTLAWAAAVVTAGGTVSSARKIVVNTLIAGLKTDGIWTKLDRLWILAAENAPSALVDLKGLVSATAQNTPTFSADDGYTFANGSPGSYLTTGFDPTSGSPNYTQNSCMMAAWCVTDGTGTLQRLMGLIKADVSTTVFVAADDGAANVNFKINDTYGDAAISAVNGGTRGFWAASRTASNLYKGYKNGSQIGSNSTNASLAPDSTAPYIGGVNFSGYWNTQGCDAQIAAAVIGGGLDDTESANLYNNLRTYMTSVGVP